MIVVDNENLEIVEILLRHDDIKIGNAVLYAIKEGVYRIVELLINHPSVTRDMLSCQWSKLKQIDDQESDDYSPDISPIILAAQCNQFEVLQLLLDRGACIERPHALTCSCSTCKRQMKEDSLRHSLLRIHCYRALASPAWMSLTSADPVLTAFKMSRELKILAMQEDEFKDIYAGLSAQCKCYACDLLEQCRSNEEVMAVLNRGCDSDDEDYHYESSSLMLSRLKLALKYEQKQVSAGGCHSDL
ncbi:Transient-receptor-potential-like protein [Lamellibrachia satsuma]|nr:Transient-receptor-potential-like protein [Lamellibrachia satsuma]